MDVNEMCAKAHPFKMKYEHNFFWITSDEIDDDVILAWIRDNFSGSWEYYYVQFGEANVSCPASKTDYLEMILQPTIIISIQTEQDAAHFKLRWT